MGPTVAPRIQGGVEIIAGCQGVVKRVGWWLHEAAGEMFRS